MFQKQIKQELEEEFINLNEKLYIDKDPIQVPYKFNKKEDIEISAFLTSILSFGKREIIIKKSNELMNLMNNEPYYFLIKNDNYPLISDFKHRTINNEDINYYLFVLSKIYKKYNNLEKFFNNDIKNSLIKFHNFFFSYPHEKRNEKHIPNINKNSASKRINMFLRWMIRNNKVDFGIWKSINPCNLFIPLDIHIGNISRKLNITKRKSNDWKTVEEITTYLKKLDNQDPIKYDLVLFNLDFDY